MSKRKTIWRWWAKALGEKPSHCDRESDTIAWIRTFIFISYLVTNLFIISGVVRHWNDGIERVVEFDQSEQKKSHRH